MAGSPSPRRRPFSTSSTRSTPDAARQDTAIGKQACPGHRAASARASVTTMVGRRTQRIPPMASLSQSAYAGPVQGGRCSAMVLMVLPLLMLLAISWQVVPGKRL
jgi:hypothetical protein